MGELFNLEIFFESSPDLLCIAGFDGYFKRVNAAVSDVLEYSMEELLSRPINSFVYSEDLQRTIQSRQSIIGGNTLRHFDNRYVTKTGKVVWLSWTSVQIQGKDLIFGVAKDITQRKMLEESGSESREFNNFRMIVSAAEHQRINNLKAKASNVDQVWLTKLEDLIRMYAGRVNVTLSLLSDEMAISERQLFRRIKTTLGMTPNKYIRLIRLQLAMEGLREGKYRTVSEASFASGFKTPGYFNSLFKEVYGTGISGFI
jgi:PAS domain S-box-containing protein